jgi:thiol-disulfide isomerase/thioredoxin
MVQRLVLVALTVALVGSVGVASSSASVAGRELSKRIVVTGRKLKSSSRIETSADPAIGKPAPGLTGQGFDGKTVTFVADGKPRIMIFLAHWCPHCQATVPRLVKLAVQGKLAAVEIDTVTTNTSKDLPNYPPSKWLKREKWPFKPVLADDAHAHALLAFGGDAFPFFVFIDASGKIVARASGELDPSSIAELARRLATGQSLYK